MDLTNYKMVKWLLNIELVANTFYCSNAIIANFFTYFAYVHIHRTRKHIDICTPDVLQ